MISWFRKKTVVVEPSMVSGETQEILRTAALRELVRRNLVYTSAWYESMSIKELEDTETGLYDVRVWAATQDEHVKHAYEYWIDWAEGHVSKAWAVKGIVKDFPVPPFPSLRS
jgi:hypothetical protein